MPYDTEDAADIAMYDARKAELLLLRGNSHGLDKMKLSPLAVLGEIVWLMSQSSPLARRHSCRLTAYRMRQLWEPDLPRFGRGSGWANIFLGL